MYTDHRHNILLLSSRFQYPGHRLFFTQARLFFDRIELKGWRLGKKYERAIPLDAVADVEWDTDADAAVFHLNEGEPVRLRFASLDSWKRSLEQRFRWNTTNYVPKPAANTNTTMPLHELITYATSMG